MYIAVAGDYEYTSDTTTSVSFEPQKAIGEGFCFDCDKPVAIEYDQWSFEGYGPAKVCQECGGHDVEFMGRVAKRLWECIEALDEWPELAWFIHIP